MRKELPFKHIEEPEWIAKEGESEVFEFKPKKGKEYVFKEVYRALGYYQKPLKEMANDMKIVFEDLKKHYGDKVANTYFIIGKNKEGEPCIIKIQEKVKGIPLDELEGDDSRYKKAYKQQKEITADIRKVTIEIAKDPRLKNYAEAARVLICDINSPSNLIVDKKGNLTAIDW